VQWSDNAQPSYNNKEGCGAELVINVSCSRLKSLMRDDWVNVGLDSGGVCQMNVDVEHPRPFIRVLGCHISSPKNPDHGHDQLLLTLSP